MAPFEAFEFNIVLDELERARTKRLLAGACAHSKNAIRDLLEGLH